MEVCTLEGEVQTLKGNFQILAEEVQILKGNFQTLTEEVQTLKGKVQSLADEIPAMKRDIQTLMNEIGPMKEELREVKDNVRKLNIRIENEISPAIQLLAENYVPAAQKYERTISEFEEVKKDVSILKEVVEKHSKKLNKVAGD